MVIHGYKYKPEKCPACGSEKILDIAYGYPSPEAVMAADDGEIALGGCNKEDDDPDWQCGDCHMVLHKLD